MWTSNFHNCIISTNSPYFFHRTNETINMLQNMIGLHILNRVIRKQIGKHIQIMLNINFWVLQYIYTNQTIAFMRATTKVNFH